MLQVFANNWFGKQQRKLWDTFDKPASSNAAKVATLEFLPILFVLFFFYIFLHILTNAAKVATVSNFYIFYPVFTYCYKLLHFLKFSKGF